MPVSVDPAKSPAARRGLSSEQAAARLAVDGPNELPAAKPRSLLQVALDVLREPMLLLLVATGVAYLLLGDVEEALAVLAAIGVVVGISLYQAHKTEHALQALRDLSSPRALVVRDGQPTRIAGRDVVCSDLLMLREGDRVAADARIESCSNLTVDESLLTGESVPVVKGEEDGGLVYSGTLVVRGTGDARVTAVGSRTELGRIGATLSRLEVGKTPLQVEVSQVVRVMALVGLAICGAVAVAYGIRRHEWLDGVLAGLTVAISMVPEEFPVVLTVFLALGAWRISRSRVLTRHIPAIETLGAATVLCVDKTGTLTMNTMSVSAVSAGDVVVDVRDERATLDASHTAVVEASILACRPEPFNPMERAFIGLGHRLGIDAPGPDWTLVHEYPLSDGLLAVTHVWTERGRPGYVVATKGAPEAIAALCALDDTEAQALYDEVARMGRRGLRVLGVARCHYLPPALPDSPFAFHFTLLGLAGLEDPVRPGVPAAIEECRTAGIRVVMITGDHIETALNIAGQVGLAHGGTYLTGTDVSALGDDELRHRIADVNVFARVVPAQKLRIVTALRARGEVVAMTGDGVNDAPALKAAHIGIAMGERGTDVAREAASLVLLDDDFSSIVRAVQLGRRIYDNITKAMSYVLGIHVPIAGVSMIPVLVGAPMVLMPVHIILMELIIDPACSVAFEMEPPDTELMRRPPRDPQRRLFSPRLVVRSLAQGAGAMGAALAVFFGTRGMGYGELDVRTLTFATLMLSNLALILANRSITRSVIADCRTPNPALWMLCAGALAVLAAVLFVPALRDVFRLSMPHPDDLSIVFCAVAAALAWMELVKRATRTT